MRGGQSVLLTGFDPFGGETINPSWEAVRRLQGECIDGCRIETLLLPTEFGRSLPLLLEALAEEPRVVIAVGQAGGSGALALERVAVNIDDAAIPDNAGYRPVDIPVAAGGPAAYFSTLPLKALRAALRAAGIPAEISHSAGSFVCNHVFYGLMHRLAQRAQPLRTAAGFVHVPYLPEQAARIPGAIGMDSDTVARALSIIVRVTLQEFEGDAGRTDG